MTLCKSPFPLFLYSLIVIDSYFLHLPVWLSLSYAFPNTVIWIQYFLLTEKKMPPETGCSGILMLMQGRIQRGCRAVICKLTKFNAQKYHREINMINQVSISAKDCIQSFSQKSVWVPCFFFPSSLFLAIVDGGVLGLKFHKMFRELYQHSVRGRGSFPTLHPPLPVPWEGWNHLWRYKNRVPALGAITGMRPGLVLLIPMHKPSFSLKIPIFFVPSDRLIPT